MPSDAPSPTPLVDFQIPRFVPRRDLLLDGAYPPSAAISILDIYGSELLAYTRLGFGWEATQAWEVVLDGARAPQPWQHAGADALIRAVYDSLFGPISAFLGAPSDPDALAAIFADAKGFLIDADRIRTFPTRRALVDALYDAQHLSAYLALLEARDAIAATLPGLPATDRALTQDLLARIDQAVSPYFKN